MREIKFRGKNLNTKEWVYGDLLQWNDGETAIGVHGQFIDDGYHFNENYDKTPYVDETTVGQFTGLKDKNGKEIYEGDLIKAPSGRIYAVIFSTWKYEEKREFLKVIDIYEHTGWCISLDGVNPCELLDSEVCQGSIIGSVYDNPELLKGGNDDHT
ncbi:YopX family protein [Parabacteroides distasonis]|uniref:YopX family protein n=1 Tax=Parabacteroides distasonis TaxID=823 RepID=A0AAX3QVB9_PARDI|nr:YopX family protein [Parabacteroides distasonis]WET65445.1 YopX family protein [Parabacteroides distasonis]